MTRGLVIGKFMPIHFGHVSLIEFSAAHCKELIVSMSWTASDPIPFQLRLSWLKEIFRNENNITIAAVEDNFDREDLPIHNRTKIWADFIRKAYGQIDVVFSSESYGEPFAKHLNASHRMFDLERKNFPVSASLIRSKPFQYWQYIPPVVRPYFVKKVCFYGSESTGKSTMAEKIAKRFHTEWVPEVAREFITSNEFTLEDIEKIAKAHYERIIAKTRTADKILICDTDAITTAIYSQHYLGSVPPIVSELERKIRFDLYFLFDIDVKWVADGLRDLGEQRQQMFLTFKEELIKRNIEFVLVSGDYATREELIAKKLTALLSD